MARFRVMAIASGLLLAISGPSLAAQQSRQSSRTHFEAAVKKDRSGATAPYHSSSVPPYDPRGTSAYPFGPGVNFPYPDRPYGAPDRW